jgi:DHA2 family multidrug resistance protein
MSDATPGKASLRDWLAVAAAILGAFTAILDIQITNSSLADIQGALGASPEEGSWISTAYLMAEIIVIPLTGWLGSIFGLRRYLAVNTALFIGFSIACALSSSLTEMILFRAGQGFTGGVLIPTAITIVRTRLPKSQQGIGIALFGLTATFAPAIGPTVGGWLTDNLSWHWVFLINVPIGLLSLTLVSIFVDEPPALKKAREKLLRKGLRIDFVGFALVALFLGSLEVTLDRGQREDWFSSPMITTFAILSAAGLIAFIPWELSRKEPIVKIQLYGQRNFLIANIFMLIMGVIIFGSTQFIPQLLQEVLGYTATNAGLALTMGGLATLLVMPLAGFLTGKVDPRYLIGFALTIQGIALWNMSTLDTQMSFDSAAYARMIQSVGLPFLFVPITAVSYVGLKSQDNNQASALMNVSRNLGGTFGISFVQTMLARRAQTHQAQYVEGLNPLNPGYVQGLQRITHGLMDRGLSQAQAGKAAAAVLYRNLEQQANMLSYVDVFHVLMLVVFAALPLVFLMRKPKKGAAGGGAAA